MAMKTGVKLVDESFLVDSGTIGKGDNFALAIHRWPTLTNLCLIERGDDVIIINPVTLEYVIKPYNCLSDMQVAFGKSVVSEAATLIF